MSRWNRLWRVAELPTTKAGVERAFSYFIAGVRLGTVAQMLPALHIGVATSPHRAAYIACWAAAALASIVGSAVTLVRRRPLGAAASCADFALACLLLVLAPMVLQEGERFGTWVAYQPGYALSVILVAGGVRGRVLWAGGLLGIIAAYTAYLGGAVGGNMTWTALGNILTYVVYALVIRMFYGFTRRIARDADDARAREAELARREEERRAQVLMHNGVAVLRLLTEPAGDAERSRLIDLAEVELRRMRSYLRGGQSRQDAAAVGAGQPVAVAALVERVCGRFADLHVDALLDLGAGLRLAPARADAVERALESLLLNVRVHAGASEVVVHLDQHDDRTWSLTVRDDGDGFDPQTVTPGIGLREVVVGELCRQGFEVDIDAAPGAGTTVTIRSGAEPTATAVAHDTSRGAA
ncbi:ATP-binding protein [Catellatospora sp. KI3]|uniref:sensor histidine kinase n=1 Tax=Catellatospora sp. KI3 TaxID=3041620 RepID=UPI0024831DC4|nr:ATP-binding protein [Catellatospora sp. KI3]MDI1465390.1 ATP-binding protein [Catellatospora sp. KI3]